MKTRHQSRKLIWALALAGMLPFLVPGLASPRPIPSRTMGVLAVPSRVCRELLTPFLPDRVLADRPLAEEIFVDEQGYRVTREAIVVGATGSITTFDYACTFGALALTPVRVDLVAYQL